MDQNEFYIRLLQRMRKELEPRLPLWQRIMRRLFGAGDQS